MFTSDSRTMSGEMSYPLKPIVQKKVVDESGLLKVVPKSIQFRRLESNAQLKLHIGRFVPFREETPMRPLQQSVDLDPCRGFIHVLTSVRFSLPPFRLGQSFMALLSLASQCIRVLTRWIAILGPKTFLLR